jgi:hypothetical protein
MKPSTALLCSGVILSLILSLTALIIVTQNNGNLAPNFPDTTPIIPPATPEYTTPTITFTPQPTPTPPITDLTITHTETSREEKDGTTKITLTIDVTYNDGANIPIDYSDFYLQLAVGRMTVLMSRGTAAPQNSGSFTIGPAHKTQTFQLNFEFNTTDFNGMDIAKMYYYLEYNGSATIQWTNHGWH